MQASNNGQIGDNGNGFTERVGSVLAYIFIAGLLGLFLAAYIPHFFF